MSGKEPFVLGVEAGSSSFVGGSVNLGRDTKVAGLRIPAGRPCSEAVYPWRTPERVPEEQPHLLREETPPLWLQRRPVTGTEA